MPTMLHFVASHLRRQQDCTPEKAFLKDISSQAFLLEVFPFPVVSNQLVGLSKIIRASSTLIEKSENDLVGQGERDTK